MWLQRDSDEKSKELCCAMSILDNTYTACSIDTYLELLSWLYVPEEPTVQAVGYSYLCTEQSSIDCFALLYCTEK